MIKLKNLLFETTKFSRRFLNEKKNLFSKVAAIELNIVGNPDEVDEDREHFLHASQKSLSPEKMSSMFNTLDIGFGKGQKGKLPYTHRQNIRAIVNDDGKTYDLDKLKRMITTRPSHLLDKNEKMKHSGNELIQFFDLGLPAAVALVYNEQKNEFVIVNTCPGKGECVLWCYAMKGGFVQFAHSSLYATKVVNFLLNDPDGFEAMLVKELSNKVKNHEKKGIKVRVRWHDSGDFFSSAYLELAIDIAKKFPSVEFYAYTKLSDVASASLPPNLLTRFSMEGASEKEKEKSTKNPIFRAAVVPLKLWSDLVIMSPNGRPAKGLDNKLIFKKPRIKYTQELKSRIFEKYKDMYDIADIKNLLMYSEYLSNYKKLSKNRIYSIIVGSGDGDFSASERNVANVFNLQH